MARALSVRIHSPARRPRAPPAAPPTPPHRRRRAAAAGRRGASRASLVTGRQRGPPRVPSLAALERDGRVVGLVSERVDRCPELWPTRLHGVLERPRLALVVPAVRPQALCFREVPLRQLRVALAVKVL